MLKALISDIKHFRKLTHQKQMLIVSLIVLLFGASIVVGAYLSRGDALPGGTTEKGTGTEEGREEVEREPSTTLAINPDTHTMKVGDSVDMEVTLREIPVVSADIVLTFDPDVLEISPLANGTVFPTQVTDSDEKEVDSDAGLIHYHGTVPATRDASENATEGVVFSFSAKALAPSEATTIGFDLDRTKTALGGTNTLGLTVGSVIRVEE